MIAQSQGLAPLLILIGLAIFLASVALLVRVVSEAKYHRGFLEHDRARRADRDTALMGVVAALGPVVFRYIEDSRRFRSRASEPKNNVAA